MFDLIARCWGSVECLDQLTRWSTVATFVAPMFFGIIALVTESHSKRLEDAQHKGQISGLEAANQKLVGELNLAERQLQVLTEAQEPWRMSLEKMNKFREELKSSLTKG